MHPTLRSSALAAAAAALALCGACAALGLAARWTPQPLLLDGDEHDWQYVDAATLGPVTLKARNDSKDLYLYFSASDEAVKAQWLGLFQQDVTVWLDPGGRHQRKDGLRLTLLPPPRTPAPWHAKDEWAFLNSCAQRLVRVHTRPDGTLQSLSLSAQEGATELHLVGNRLALQLRLPLAPAAPGLWSLGLAPGGRVTLVMETSPIAPELGRDVLHGALLPDSRRQAEAQAPVGSSGPGVPLPLRSEDPGDDQTLYQTPSPLLLWASLALAPAQPQ
ncbi:MAG TPA: hypothetical protein VK842_07755 [bacterium]|jgi:hypothetical protein|nr:hypothetical protein [bacterium]